MPYLEPGLDDRLHRRGADRASILVVGLPGDHRLRTGADAGASIGTVTGLFFGFSFGMGGLGAAVLGAVADARGIEYVYAVCAYLPLLGLLTALLPDQKRLPAEGYARG